MPRYPRRRYARKGRKTVPKRKYAKRTYKKKSFAVRVKQVIHRLAENKVQTVPYTNQPIAYASTSVNPTFISLMPTPTQGTTVQQRIGNEITVVKSTIRGYVNILPYNATTNPLPCPLKVKMWLCSRKRTNRAISSAPIAVDFANFFQLGNTNLGFQSNILDILAHNNLDWWSIHAFRQFELSPNMLGQTFGTNTFLQSPSGKMSLPFSFDLTKHLGKLKYNDDGTYPTNKELYLVFQTVRADGQTDAASFSYSEFHAIVEHHFEDS